MLLEKHPGPNDLNLDFLPNGLERYYHPRTDGGGEWMRYPLAQQIRDCGKKDVYNNCYEWCSGSAPIGFYLLDQGLTENLCLVDKYDLAISDIGITVEQNDLSDKVFSYRSDTVRDIPNTQPWDLVVSNPPHSWVPTPDMYSDDELKTEYLSRVLLDQDLQTHIEFFNNVGERLAPDAEMFIIEAEPMFVQDHGYTYEDAGFELIGNYIFNHQEAIQQGFEHNYNIPPSIRWNTLHLIKKD